MAGINFHPAPGAPGTPMLQGWYGVRGVGDIVATNGFVVPDRDMVPSVSYRATIGDILATQGFTVPDRDMNPVADYVSGARAMPGHSSGGCGGCGCNGSKKGSLNGIAGMGDLAADFSAIQGDITAGNYSALLSAPIMGIPYALPILAAALFILPSMMGGSSGGRRRR